MEIRNALQKIENYLTVVSNLNKTILSEGTMSRDELLLMKKYLYTSIDRIEDIERLLVIDRRDEKSFSPTETMIETPNTSPKAKEIVEVEENSHIGEVEAALSKEEIQEVEETVEEIHAELKEEEKEFVGEITPEVIAEVKEEVLEVTPEIKAEEIEEPQISTIEITPVIENIITEDFAFTDELEDFSKSNKDELSPMVEVQSEHSTAEESEMPLVNQVSEESIASKFEEQTPLTFAEEMANRKKEETSFFEQMNEKLNTPQQQLFEMFDDHKEELHETFSKNTYEPLKTNFDDAHPFAGAGVLVAEEKVTVVEQLTPSSLNDIFKPQVTVETVLPVTEVFKPQTVVETVAPKVNKTFSESIALNDKFIFVRELFGNQFAEYENGLKQLDAQPTFEAAEQYCKENLWKKFNWNDKTTALNRFMELLQKRYN